MTDRELAASWDADNRQAATITFIAGVVVAVGAAIWLTVGMGVGEAAVQGGPVNPFVSTAVAGALLLTDVALLVFVIGLAHTTTAHRRFEVAVAGAVAGLATSVSATIHLVWGYLPTSLEVTLPAELSMFTSWLALNLWMLPLFGVLVGATLLALALALHGSAFRFARRLAPASAVVGGLLCVLGPFTGFGPAQSGVAAQSGLFAALTVLVAVVGISVLLLAALIWLGRMLWATRHQAQPAASVRATGSGTAGT